MILWQLLVISLQYWVMMLPVLLPLLFCIWCGQPRWGIPCLPFRGRWARGFLTLLLLEGPPILLALHLQQVGFEL